MIANVSFEIKKLFGEKCFIFYFMYVVFIFYLKPNKTTLYVRTLVLNVFI